MEFAKRLPSHLKINITLIDFGDNIYRFDESRISINKIRDIREFSGSVDVIVASASLEHVPDLREIIESLMKILIPGGLFYARTPYIMPIRKFIPLEFSYPAHFHDLGSDYWNRFSDIYSTRVKIIVSRPSIVEVSFVRNPIRYIITYLLKLPCHIETYFFPFNKDEYLWSFVGGWEVLFQRE